MELKKIDKIEIRSEEVQDILGASPRWIIRAGISVILLIVIALLVGSWFFKYPDIIQARIKLTTQNPPASLKAFSSGKITTLFVKEKQILMQNDLIAIIENTAHDQDVFLLENILDTIKDLDRFEDMDLELGDIQQNYASFSRLLKDYQSFKDLNYYTEKEEAIKQQKKDFLLYYRRLWKQRNIKEKELSLAKKQFKRDKQLFETGVYSSSDYEKAEKVLLQETLAFENTRSTLANIQMQINQLDQQILDLALQNTKEEARLQTLIEESLQNLKSQIERWKKQYVIISPIDGYVTFTKIWSENQNVQTGEIVATVIPNNATDIIGKIEIPALGVGKVKLGQTVNIKFDNFPYMEFGLLRASIKSISLVPIQTEVGAIYIAEIDIQDTLISNYGKHLKFSQEMTGTADIITDDIRLLERFFNPLKAIWKKNIE